MINVNVSKALPPALHSYLSAFVPGIFFGISLLLGNPDFVGCQLERVHAYVTVPPYLQLATALFLAFILGSAAMMFVSFLQYLLTYVHSMRLVLREELARWPMLPFWRWMGKFQSVVNRPEYFRLYTRIALRASDPDSSARHGYRAWNQLARKILQDRYGIELHKLEDEWEFFFWSLGRPTDMDWRGPIMMIAFEAAGWCGLIATRLAPALRNPYYIILLLVFMVLGLQNDYYVAGRRADPSAVAMRQVRGLLREYENDRRAQTKTANEPDEPEKRENED